MLDIESRKYVDAGGDDLLDVEIALGVSGAGGVGVGEFVDKNELRPALEDSVEIHFGQQVTLVLDLLPRDDFEAFEQGLGLAPAMGLDHADDDINPITPSGLSRQQHLVGLADAGCGAEKDLQAPAALLLGCGEQRLRRRPSLALRHTINIVHSDRKSV